MTSSSAEITNQSNELVETAVKNLSKTPLVSIHQLTENCLRYLDEIDFHLESMYETVSEEDVQVMNGNLSPGMSASVVHSTTQQKEGEFGKVAVLLKFTQLREELGDHYLMFEEMLDMMKRSRIPPNSGLVDLPTKNGSAKRSKSTRIAVDRGGDDDAMCVSPQKPIALLFQSTPPRQSLVKSLQEPTTGSARSPFITSPTQSPKKSPKAFTSPTQPLAKTQVEHLASPSASRLVPLHSPKGTTYEGSMFAFTEIAIEDFSNWLRGACDFFQKIPRSDPLPGILDMTTETITSIFNAANGNIRTAYAKSLKDVKSYNSLMEDNPDVAVLLDIVMSAVAKANIFDWFDDFCDECLVWDENIEQQQLGKKRKKKAVHSELPELVLLKSRFINALSDLERLGIIKTKNGGTEVSRVAYIWL